MKTRMTSIAVVATLTLAGATPAFAQPQPKTELIELGGARVDQIQIRHEIDGVWVLDNQNVLYRDTSRGHYLVTLEEACKPIERRNGFNFSPASPWRLVSHGVYKLRFQAGKPCKVARVEEIDRARADALHAQVQRREW